MASFKIILTDGFQKKRRSLTQKYVSRMTAMNQFLQNSCNNGDVSKDIVGFKIDTGYISKKIFSRGLGLQERIEEMAASQGCTLEDVELDWYSPL